ncbi:unnamed protein product [Didymodactylos carnosus]|uniref:NAD(P)(+)--arginine ADP-ribosyltransferase n=1 Tax=Didymodactylos carnosus TaxID=1234261 RepID=A0A814VKV6_9BILA|nr:unnamed protein product [Didymodactylos carnosus]CAF1189775.1 unnamed protein product [Didymodactylos carnosus]CAF3839947.1 unnamed protein product [Didymodactylos carnosus]CAF3954104.1 unnamed protein product [Didymodactylos carnosus]
MSMSKNVSCSNFYHACRNGNIEKVRSGLGTLTLAEINRLEPNGSTALHAATYYGHTEIVCLLLSHHASQTIINRYKLTPYQEAFKDEIKQLFRCPSSNRFLSNVSEAADCDWVFATEDIIKKSRKYRQKLVQMSHNYVYSIEVIIKTYLQNFVLTPAIATVLTYFRLAIIQDDPTYIVRAYTVESEFYTRFNRDLASTTENILNIKIVSFDACFLHYSKEHGRIAGILARHPKFRYTFTGIVYRGMQCSEQDLRNYVVDKRVMTKTFMSTSQLENIVYDFAFRGEAIPVICKYEIINKGTAMNIETMSDHSSEQEVLIIPYTVFTITKFARKTHIDGKQMIEIELRECENEHNDNICAIL